MKLGRLGSSVYKHWSAKDYVQDGLVAMWDGIENAGWGTHDPNATSWVDLSSGNIVSLPQGFSFVGNSLAVANANGEFPCSDYNGSYFSVEYVFSLDDDNTSRECLFESKAANNSFRYKAAAYVEDFWNHGGLTSRIFQRSGNIGKVMSIASTWNDIFSSTNVGIDYLNGEPLGNKTIPYYSAISSLNGFRIGRKNSSGTTYHHVYSTRLYSRALTAAEISRNYRIDKYRFNLPNLP